MKPVINEYVRALSQPGYDAARRNAFVAAMVSKQLMRRTAERREAAGADSARIGAAAAGAGLGNIVGQPGRAQPDAASEKA